MRPAPESRVVGVAAPMGLAALALWARTALTAQVFQGGEVIPVEVDGFFHLRRIVQTAASFPTVPLREPRVDWPHGAVVPWPEGFDWLVGAAARLAVGASPAVVAAWAPVVLGLLVVLGTYALTLRMLRGAPGARGSAFLAGLFVALAPQSVAVSVVGRVDHHVAEQLSALALLAWCVARPSAGAPGALRYELLGALALGASVWCFNGSVLYAAVTAGALALAALSEPARRPLLGQGALAFAPAALFVAWRSAAAVRAHGRPFDHLFSSYLQPALLLVGGGLVALAALVAWADPGPARMRVARRAAALTGFGLLALAAVMALAPALREEVVAGLRRWLAREDGYMGSIDEVQPLFGRNARRGPVAAVTFAFGAAGLALPLAVVFGVRWLGVARGALALGCFTAALSVLTVLQMRFGRVLIPVAGVCLGVGAAALVARLREGAWRAWVPFGIAALWMLDPRARAWLWRRPPGVTAEVVAARFLRANSPADAPVFTTWGDGNVVLALGERPVLVTSFGSYIGPETFWRAERAWLGTEESLDAFLDPRGVCWMVAGASHFGGIAVDPLRPSPTALDAQGRRAFDANFFRRVPLAALVLGGSGAPRTGVAQLERWMPRLAVGTELRTRESVVPSLWVYERVAGATLAGAGPEGALVTLTTRLLVQGQTHRHTAWTRVAGGSFALRTTVPTGWRSGNLASQARALLAVGEGPPREVEVPEEAVRAGGTVRVE